MNCCAHCSAAEETFDTSFAARELAKYRRRGPVRSTRHLLSALERADVSDATVIDVGGGIGAIAHELLAAGAARASIVDASQASLAAAREESARRNTSARLELVHGDFASLGTKIPQADIVTLDKVVCCYPDMEGLLGAATQHAGRLFGIVFPRDAWLVRAGVAVNNVIRRIQKCAFCGYIWPHAAIDAAIRRAGFTLQAEHRGIIWFVRLYARAPGR